MVNLGDFALSESGAFDSMALLNPNERSYLPTESPHIKGGAPAWVTFLKLYVKDAELVGCEQGRLLRISRPKAQSGTLLLRVTDGCNLLK
jgi:hypothetical protein